MQVLKARSLPGGTAEVVFGLATLVAAIVVVVSLTRIATWARVSAGELREIRRLLEAQASGRGDEP